MNKRDLKLDKYGISGKRYKELCGFCEQYPEWIDELKEKTDTVHSIEITDMPIYHGNSDVTANLATRRTELQRKCDIVENTAKQACSDLYEFLIMSVCYCEPFWYLKDVANMPCSQRTFYDYRRYFFFLLDRNKKI